MKPVGQPRWRAETRERARRSRPFGQSTVMRERKAERLPPPRAPRLRYDRPTGQRRVS